MLEVRLAPAFGCKALCFDACCHVADSAAASAAAAVEPTSPVACIRTVAGGSASALAAAKAENGFCMECDGAECDKSSTMRDAAAMSDFP